MKIFISHIHEEAPLAAALKRIIEERVPGAKAWVSGVDIKHGQQWLAGLNEAIEAADKVLVLCSAASVAKPWVNFESGVGWGRSIDVLPVCHTGMTAPELPFPLSALQGQNLYTKQDLHRLIALLEGDTEGLEARWSTIQDALNAIDYVPVAVQPVPDPVRDRSILLDTAHGQGGWPQQRQGTLFDWPTRGFGGLVDEGDFDIHSISRTDQFRARDMQHWDGMIVALPFRARMQTRTIRQITEWVRSGGRLLLLGYELGDLHHGGNLNDLAAQFGLRFNGDMVAPAGWRQGKPYDKDVSFATTSQQSLFEGVDSVVWRNLQTIALEPGTRPLLRVGPAGLVVPEPDSVGFSEGFLTMPSPQFTIIEHAHWLPVLALATPHLTGRGAVLACGTWHLLPETDEAGGNVRFMQNLLRWLTSPGLSGSE